MDYKYTSAKYFYEDIVSKYSEIFEEEKCFDDCSPDDEYFTFEKFYDHINNLFKKGKNHKATKEINKFGYLIGKDKIPYDNSFVETGFCNFLIKNITSEDLELSMCSLQFITNAFSGKDDSIGFCEALRDANFLKQIKHILTHQIDYIEQNNIIELIYWCLANVCFDSESFLEIVEYEIGFDTPLYTVEIFDDYGIHKHVLRYIQAYLYHGIENRDMEEILTKMCAIFDHTININIYFTMRDLSYLVYYDDGTFAEFIKEYTNIDPFKLLLSVNCVETYISLMPVLDRFSEHYPDLFLQTPEGFEINPLQKLLILLNVKEQSSEIIKGISVAVTNIVLNIEYDSIKTYLIDFGSALIKKASNCSASTGSFVVSAIQVIFQISPIEIIIELTGYDLMNIFAHLIEGDSKEVVCSILDTLKFLFDKEWNLNKTHGLIDEFQEADGIVCVAELAEFNEEEDVQVSASSLIEVINFILGE